MNMLFGKLRVLLTIVLFFSTIYVFSQGKWKYNVGLGASLNAGNVNNCNVSQDASLTRNDSVLAFDCHYRFLYSSMIQKNDVGRRWEETNFEINRGVKTDLYQYGKYSPFLACEMLTNKYKGYDLKLSGLLGLKLRVFTIPSFCDYSVSAAFVFDWNDFTDDVSALPNNNYRISIRPKIKQKLADNLALLHYTFFQPSVLDLSDYIIYSETKLQTQITKKLFLDFSFRYDYHSRVPLETYRHHDILTEVSIRYKN